MNGDNLQSRLTNADLTALEAERLERMKKKRKSLNLNNPLLVALWMLRPTGDNLHPRYAWDMETVMPSDLIVKQKEIEDVHI